MRLPKNPKIPEKPDDFVQATISAPKGDAALRKKAYRLQAERDRANSNRAARRS